MFLKKCKNVSNIDNTVNADIRILNGNVRLEQIQDTEFLWRCVNGRKEKLKFKNAFSIKHKDFATGVRDCTYVVHGRKFTDLSCMMGTDIMKIDDEYILREYEDGRKFIFYSREIPTFDSGDREWNSETAMAVYCDEAGLNMIYSSCGYKISYIEIYLGLQNAYGDFKRFIDYLQCSDFGIRFDTKTDAID